MANPTVDKFATDFQSFLDGFEGWVALQNADGRVLIPNVMTYDIESEIETTDKIPGFNSKANNEFAISESLYLALNFHGLSFAALISFWNGTAAATGKEYVNEELTIATNVITASQTPIEDSETLYWEDPDTGDIYFFEPIDAAPGVGQYQADYVAKTFTFKTGDIDDAQLIQTLYAYTATARKVTLERGPVDSAYTIFFYSGSLNPNTGKFINGRVVGILQGCTIIQKPNISGGSEQPDVRTARFAINKNPEFSRPVLA